MGTPRWFLAILAACIVALSVAAAFRLRWQEGEGDWYFDTWRSRSCGPSGECLRYGVRTLEVAPPAASRPMNAAPQAMRPVDPRLDRLRELARERIRRRDTASTPAE